MRASQSLAGLHRDWTRLGEADPLWAVCVDPAKRGGRWGVQEFLASGRAEIADAMASLERLGLCAGRDDALDFGCGAGRLTAALAGHFSAVTGVDISPPMLARARTLHAGNERCRFVHNDSIGLTAFADESFDLVYASLVLQHMPTDLARAYLAEFIRVLRADGAIVTLVPEAHLRTARGMVYARAPHRLIGLVQRTVFRYPAPMQMHVLPADLIQRLIEAPGGRLVASLPHAGYGGHWQMAEHFIVKDRERDAS
jgi:ubiquinone/menaquinone biosynthesis C-methylase UbiE